MCVTCSFSLSPFLPKLVLMRDKVTWGREQRTSVIRIQKWVFPCFFLPRIMKITFVTLMIPWEWRYKKMDLCYTYRCTHVCVHMYILHTQKSLKPKRSCGGASLCEGTNVFVMVIIFISSLSVCVTGPKFVCLTLWKPTLKMSGFGVRKLFVDWKPRRWKT